MNIAKAVQQGQATAQPGSPSAEIAGSMAPATLNEFAGTPQQGLPMRAPRPAPVKRQAGKMGRTRVTKTGTLHKKRF
jgi:hypothetical protein